MAIEEMLAEIIAKLDEVNAQLRICTGPLTPSPSSITTHIAGTDEDHASASFPNSKPSTASVAASTSSPTLSIITASCDDCEHEVANSTTSMDAIHAVSIAGSNKQAWEINIPTSCKLEMPSSVTSSSSTICSTPPTPSPSSEPFKDMALDSQIDVTKLFVASPIRCSTLRLYRYAGALMMVITSSASVPASSATASDQGVKLDIPATVIEHLDMQHAGSLLSACSLGTPSQRLPDSLFVTPTFTATTPMFKAFNINPTSSIVMAELCVDTNTSSTQELFEVFSLCPVFSQLMIDNAQSIFCQSPHGH